MKQTQAHWPQRITDIGDSAKMSDSRLGQPGWQTRCPDSDEVRARGRYSGQPWGLSSGHVVAPVPGLTRTSGNPGSAFSPAAAPASPPPPLRPPHSVARSAALRCSAPSASPARGASLRAPRLRLLMSGASLAVRSRRPLAASARALACAVATAARGTCSVKPGLLQPGRAAGQQLRRCARTPAGPGPTASKSSGLSTAQHRTAPPRGPAWGALDAARPRVAPVDPSSAHINVAPPRVGQMDRFPTRAGRGRFRWVVDRRPPPCRTSGTLEQAESYGIGVGRALQKELNFSTPKSQSIWSSAEWAIAAGIARLAQGPTKPRQSATRAHMAYSVGPLGPKQRADSCGPGKKWVL